MVERYRVLIVDDQPVGVSIGADRFVDRFLRKNGYMKTRLGDEFEVKYEAPERGGRKLTFQAVKESVAEQEHRYDILVFDCDLTQMDFGEHNYVNVTDPEDLEEGQRSKVFAGLELLVETPVDARPKILYTGVDAAKRLFLYLNLMSSRLTDIVILELNNIAHEEAAIGRLDQYLRHHQFAVVHSQAADMLERIEARINKGDAQAFDIADIRGVKSGGGCWSLRTLFPKETNRYQSAVEGSDKEGAKARKGELLALISANWRYLMAKAGFGVLKHPATRWSRAERARVGDVVRALDFEVDGIDLRYQRLTDSKTFRDFTAETEAIVASEVETALDSEELKLLPLENRTVTVGEYLSCLFGDERSRWKERLCRHGLYPIDLAYMCHIAFHNGQKHCVGDPTCKVTERDGKICFEWAYPQDSTSKHLAGFVAKAFKASGTPRLLGDEGVGDLFRIACWRYRGSLCLGNSQGSVEIQWTSEGQPNVEPGPARSGGGSGMMLRLDV